MVPWSPLARGILARAAVPATQTGRSEADRVALFRTPADGQIVAEVAKIAEGRG
jgi:aryl-alcohol dehydrogenase-like predicted oxidoreductase